MIRRLKIAAVATGIPLLGVWVTASLIFTTAILIGWANYSWLCLSAPGCILVLALIVYLCISVARDIVDEF